MAGYAELQGEALRLRGRVGLPDGSRLLEGEITGAVAEAEALGRRLAQDMLAKGAAEVLRQVRGH